MKKIIIIVLCSIVLHSVAEAGLFKIFGSIVGGIGSVFTGGTKNTLDLSKKNTQIGEVEARLETLSRNQIQLKELIKAEIKAEMKVDVNAQMENKIAAYDKSQKAGRDIISIKKNDATMIMYIVGGVFTLMSGLFAGLVSIITLLIRSIFRRQREVDKKCRDIAEINAKYEAVKEHRDNLKKSKDYYANIVKNGSKQAK